MDEQSAHDLEEARLGALHHLCLLDTPASESFDRITRLAAQIFDLPIAAISLTDRDRQWFKSRIGVEHDHIARDQAPCAEVAERQDVLILSDLALCPAYAESRLARDGIRFYAGAPLVTRDGHGLGALCVLGTVPRVVSAAERAALRDLAAMVMAQIELQHAYGRVDPVSGFPNRNQFLEDLADLARDRPGASRIAVLIDLARHDELSALSRVMGAGRLDEMVREAAQALRARMPADRAAYHVAATQFAFLAPDGAALDDYVGLLKTHFLDARARSSVRFLTTVSIGVMPFTLGAITPEDVLRGGHSAAQDARTGDGAINIFSAAADGRHHRRLALIESFGSAFDSPGELRLVYQPRIALATGACVGAEALLRWHHPAHGEVPPAEFIPAVERTSLIARTTDWVMRAAVAQVGAWRRAGLVLPVSLNISAANLDEPDLPHRLERCLRAHDVPVELIEIELTESALMAETAQSTACLAALAAAGFRIAIDDFGTGYSSLAYLQRLPARIVKIDRAFVADIETREADRRLIRSMIRLAQDLGYEVVAEGIETMAVAAFLREQGCEQGQGYVFGRPMAPDALRAWIEAERRAAA
ncbi:putative bifunctional diguanylate cyclase/phosphodiesterase [Sphingomonas morindae]|uniref:EAL domain-containing protein n=1 Tax=Sphingomonas morindae TaxID=1541170 RepID=A0ABY4XCZ1_9SPHN|nr:EAL domain-containing protein [Sphingomonas morindae]USI74783.1 EAL domain-containing protein [Sphingomonas morindae]